MKKTILIVEDDHGLNEGIALALQNESYHFAAAYTLQEAKFLWSNKKIDMVLLDINLPDGNGYDLLKQIRSQSATPVIMLTANDLEVDEVTGFGLGADDYITKPFSLMVLRARVERLFKRLETAGQERYEVADYLFDFGQMHFLVAGQEVVLSKTEQKLLRLLVGHPGQVLTREVLVDRIWSDGAEYVEENALSVTVNRLRKKIERKGKETAIQTVYGIGYVWAK